MTDLFKRRLESAMQDGADIAEDLADDRDVPLPPEIVGQMGLTLFQARVGVLQMNPDEGYDYPDADGREMY